jgi:hypothetical protein
LNNDENLHKHLWGKSMTFKIRPSIFVVLSVGAFVNFGSLLAAPASHAAAAAHPAHTTPAAPAAVAAPVSHAPSCQASCMLSYTGKNSGGKPVGFDGKLEGDNLCGKYSTVEKLTAACKIACADEMYGPVSNRKGNTILTQKCTYHFQGTDKKAKTGALEVPKLSAK